MRLLIGKIRFTYLFIGINLYTDKIFTSIFANAKLPIGKILPLCLFAWNYPLVKFIFANLSIDIKLSTTKTFFKNRPSFFIYFYDAVSHTNSHNLHISWTIRKKSRHYRKRTLQYARISTLTILDYSNFSEEWTNLSSTRCTMVILLHSDEATLTIMSSNALDHYNLHNCLPYSFCKRFLSSHKAIVWCFAICIIRWHNYALGFLTFIV